MAALGGALTTGRPDASGDAAGRPGSGDDGGRDEPRPLIERVGLGVIALVFAVVFGGLAVGAFASGEVFLGTMAGIGALMTVWAAAGTTRR